MDYPIKSLLAILLFALVHLFANKARYLGDTLQRRLLSLGSGVAIAYVFIDLLPKIGKNEPLITETIHKFFPFFERHAYVMALLGFLLFYVVDRSNKLLGRHAYFYLSLSSYALFNMLIGYAVVDVDNPEVKPLFLFTLAIGLHYFANDYSLTMNFGKQYNHFAKWVLIVSLLVGWVIGFCTEISASAVALISAFIGGGVIMNIMRHELPSERKNSLTTFLTAAGFYTAILLMIG
jgi:hypothetical protein